jgi:hypothetical protein
MKIIGWVAHQRNAMLLTLHGEGETIDSSELCRGSGGDLSRLKHENRRIQLDAPGHLDRIVVAMY